VAQGLDKSVAWGAAVMTSTANSSALIPSNRSAFSEAVDHTIETRSPGNGSSASMPVL